MPPAPPTPGPGPAPHPALCPADHREAPPRPHQQQPVRAAPAGAQRLREAGRQAAAQGSARRAEALCPQLPPLSPQGSAKLEKAEILQMTVDHLKMLHTAGGKGKVQSCGSWAAAQRGWQCCGSSGLRCLGTVLPGDSSALCPTGERHCEVLQQFVSAVR